MRPGGTAVTTTYVVDLGQRRSRRPESPGINFALRESSELLAW
jgi:hypothetical protein